MIPFGPQLIGQTEKALSALLGTVLSDDRLTEPEWVALRLAAQFDEAGSLPDLVRDAAHVADPDPLLEELARRGLVVGDQLTEAGRALVERIGRHVAVVTAPIWGALDVSDTVAAERTLNTVLARTRDVLAARP